MQSLQSVWLDQAAFTQFKHLDYDLKTDVLIVGGGITGVSAAYYCAKSGISCVLVEADSIGHGATGRAVGIISREAEIDLVSSKNIQVMQKYLRLGKYALRLVGSSIRDEQIECGLEAVEEWGVALELSKAANLKEIYRVRNLLGVPTTYFSKREAEKLFPFGVHAAIGSKSFIVDPAQFLAGLLQSAIKHGAAIYENTPVVKLKEDAGGIYVSTKNGTIRAKKLLLATEAYSPAIIDVPEALLLFYKRLIPTTIFAIATAPLPAFLFRSIKLERKVLWTDYELFDDFRLTPDHRIVMSGEDIEYRGSAYNSDTHNRHHWHLEKTLRELFPQLKDIPVTHRWQGTIAFSVDGFPFIGPLTEHIFFSGGYGGQGLAFGHLGGYLFSRHVLGEPQKVQSSFLSPSRILYEPIISIPSFLVDIFLKLPHPVRSLILRLTLVTLNMRDRIDRVIRR